jgi:hypothetical protein
LGLLTLLALVVTACGGAATAPLASPMPAEVETEPIPTMPAVTPTEAAREAEAQTASPQPTATDAIAEQATHTPAPAPTAVAAETEEPDPVTEPEPEPAADLPAWFSAELTDVNSGETLTVADLRGQVILVETVAIWCSNCLRQQKEVKVLHETLGPEDGLLTLVLDIDPNEDADDLKAYADQHGFDWTYAVAPREVAREIGQLYGAQFLNPPSTPMLIVDRMGQVHLLPFGRKTAEDLQQALQPFLSDGA